MAKGKSSRSGTREPSDSLTVSLRSRRQKSPLSRHLVLSQIQDLRSYYDAPALRPALLFSGSPARVGLEPAPNKNKNNVRARPTAVHRAQLAFTAPGETLVCVRRARRKEVLFAKNKAGKRGQRKARWSQWSKYKCR